MRRPGAASRGGRAATGGGRSRDRNSGGSPGFARGIERVPFLMAFTINSIKETAMKSLDFKSLVIGFLGCALIIACSGTTTRPVFSQPEPGEAGVYSIACASQFNRGFCLVFDTRYGIVRGRVQPDDVYFTPQLIHKSVYNP